MKSLFAILFLSAVLWQPFYQSGYIAYWQINKDKIAQTECINRFKPMMHCNGKCQLYKQLKKAADEEAENNKLPIAVLKIKALDTFIKMTHSWLPKAMVVCNPECNYSDYSAFPMNGFSNSLLKPPQILA